MDKDEIALQIILAIIEKADKNQLSLDDAAKAAKAFNAILKELQPASDQSQ
jgi:hypothetical protein